MGSKQSHNEKFEVHITATFDETSNLGHMEQHFIKMCENLQNKGINVSWNIETAEEGSGICEIYVVIAGKGTQKVYSNKDNTFSENQAFDKNIDELQARIENIISNSN